MGRKVIIVGAGLVGCITAIQLAERGFEVNLIEKNPEIMSGTSRIPLHLHQGGMYVCDENNEQTLRDCLFDTEAFRKILGDAIIVRPMAFAVMSDSACAPQDGRVQQKKLQEGKVLKMLAGFEKLKAIADEYQIPYPYQAYDVDALRKLQQQKTVSGDTFTVYAKRFADAVKLDMISGMVMTEESGLDMVKAKEILTQKLAAAGVRVFTSTRLTQLSQDEIGEYIVSVSRPEQEVYYLMCDQVINTAGHAGFQIDAMARDAGIVGESDIPTSWNVEAKGIGIVVVPERHRTQVGDLPEICFMHGPGMSHFAPLPYGRAGVTFSNQEGTQIDRVIVDMASYRGDAQKVVDSQMCRLNHEFFDRDVGDPALLERTKSCAKRCATFIPMLAGSEPQLYLPGALGVVNPTVTAGARSSQRVYCSRDGYHSVNAVKGGGAAAAANMVAECVEDASLSRNLQIKKEIMDSIESKKSKIKAINPDAGPTSERASKRRKIQELGSQIEALSDKLLSIETNLEVERVALLRQQYPSSEVLRAQIEKLDAEISPVGKAAPSQELKHKLIAQRAELLRAAKSEQASPPDFPISHKKYIF